MINEYLKLLRVNHWFKNLFVYFGWVIAVMLLSVTDIFTSFVKVTIALLLASFISSANYIINQITDMSFDKKHPDKKNRPLPSGKISIESAFFLSVIIFLIAFFISLDFNNVYFTASLLLLWIAGLIYNVRPVRAKDRAHIDVIVESSNNPIRFLIGWFTVSNGVLPPVSILLLTWSAAAVLMTGKRYDELFHYGKKLYPYRKTFTYYNLDTLKFLLYFYSLTTIFLMVLFSLAFNSQYLYSVPLIGLFLYWLVKMIVKGKAQARSVEDFVTRKDFVTYFFAILLLLVIIHFNSII